MKPRPVILDVDTGVDDALAIMLAIRSPELEVKGILTVSGNVHLSQTTANTLTVLDLLEAPPIPVAAGAAVPLARPGITAGDVHGGDGLGGVACRFPPSHRVVTADAVGFLLEAIGRQPGQVTLIATAPLTNIALAIEKEAQTVRKLRALFVMGGAVRVPGNVGPVSEFNFAVDPEAAAIVLQAGLPLTLVPLDVTERVVLTRKLLDSINPAGKLHAFVEEIVAGTMAFHRMRGEGEGIVLHDPLAVGVALDSSLVRREPMTLAVETRGTLTAGMAVADLRRRRRAAPTADVCVEVEAERFLRLFTERVLR
ncbi:MAG: nucleosidase [candidate division NC10 bacterium]|nr:nucleosidase [candidate division NC10 bacterium]